MKFCALITTAAAVQRLLSREESSSQEMKEQLRAELKEEIRAEMHAEIEREFAEMQKTLGAKMRSTLYHSLLGTSMSDKSGVLQGDNAEEGCNPLHFKMNVDVDALNYNMNCADATVLGSSCQVIEKVGWNCDAVKVKCQAGNIYEQQGKCTNLEAAGQRILRRCDHEDMTLSKNMDDIPATFDCSKAKREGDYCSLAANEGFNCDGMKISCAFDGTFVVDGECKDLKAGGTTQAAAA